MRKNINKINIHDKFNLLKHYSEINDFKGWDPYDGLNSKIFQSTFLKNYYWAKLIWIQLFKRSHINLRVFFSVPKEHNSKGIGLFLSGYCNLYKLAEKGHTQFGSKKNIKLKINYLSDLIIKLRSKGYSRACWGYNFDWQNREFYRPRYTPTVVATSFCGEALFNAYKITKNKNHLNTALSACEFVQNDLNRTYIDDENFIFSYSPLDNSKVYNASLLGAKLLAIGYSHNKNIEWKYLAKKATETIISKQETDGSWIYGEHKVQNWKDSFHTGFNLECIWKVSRYTCGDCYKDSFYKGLEYYLENFFHNNEIPKYYQNKIYPVDIHSPAQLITTLSHSDLLKKNKKIVNSVLKWTIENMQLSNGAFIYQKRKIFSSKIEYMRWAQAWMFRSMTEYILTFEDENLD